VVANWKRVWRPRYWLWLAVLLLLLWIFRSVSLQQVWQVLSRLSPGQILALVLANGLVLVTMSGRWWLVLRAQGHPVPYFTLAGYRLAAFGVSYFTPGPHFGGEPLQVYLLRRHHRVPGSAAVAGVTLDKLLELLVNFSFLVGGLIFVVRQQVVGGLAGLLMAGIGLAMLVVPLVILAALNQGGAPLSRILRLTDRIVPNISRHWGFLSVADYQRVTGLVRTSERQAADVCRQHPGTLWLAVLVSMVSWLLMVAEYWLVLHFLGATLTAAQTIIALTAARVAILFPLPGGLGALEASQVLAMQLLGLDPAIGLSLSLLIRARDIMFGGVGLWWGGVKS
jgi:uncharacterized protein (TIRG00374 family)